MDYQKIDELLLKIKSAYESIGAEKARNGWVENCFTNEEDEYDAVWYNKLGFMNVPNGDVIAFDIKESEINPSVVYLSHDDGEGHGYILGKGKISRF